MTALLLSRPSQEKSLPPDGGGLARLLRGLLPPAAEASNKDDGLVPLPLPSDSSSDDNGHDGKEKRFIGRRVE